MSYSQKPEPSVNNDCSAFLAHTRSQALQNWAENAEPPVVAPEKRVVGGIPVGEGAARGIDAPTAPARLAERARACSRAVVRARAWSPVISKWACWVASIPIPAPLKYIPRHVVKPELIR